MSSSNLNFLSPLHRATRQIGIHLHETMGRLDLQPTEGHLLSYLRSYAPCPIHEISRVFGWKRSTLTSILDRLENRGLLSRSVHPEDRRSFLISLTDEGRKLADQCQVCVEKLESRIRSEIEERDLLGFQNVMSGIARATGVEVRPETRLKEKT